MARREHEMNTCKCIQQSDVESVATGFQMESITAFQHATLLKIYVTLKAPLSCSILQFVIWAVY